MFAETLRESVPALPEALAKLLAASLLALLGSHYRWLTPEEGPAPAEYARLVLGMVTETARRRGGGERRDVAEAPTP